MSSLMENSSMTELFYAIDNISNNNDENDTIVEKIIDKFYILFKSHLSYKRKKEEKAREAMLKSYKEYLYGFNKIITKQMTVIESMLNEPFTSDMSDIFVKLQKELDEYSMKKYIIEFSFMSSFLSKKECDIFKNVQIYSFLDKYHNNLKECDIIPVDKTEQTEVTTKSIEWKNYYYLVICMEKQRDFNQTLLSNYISRRENIDDIKFFVSKSSLCAADFQGQLSKSVFYQRKKLKLTQVELSKISGVDRSMIAKIEKANQPTTLETAIKLLSALNMGIAICPFGGRGEKSLLQLELHK